MTLPFTMSRRGWTLLAVLVRLLLPFAWLAFRAGPLAPVTVTLAQVEERSISQPCSAPAPAKRATRRTSGRAARAG